MSDFRSWLRHVLDYWQGYLFCAALLLVALLLLLSVLLDTR